MSDFKDTTKWAIIDEAPLTSSGLNEIVATTVTKREAVIVAKALNLQITGRNAWYAIVRKP